MEMRTEGKKKSKKIGRKITTTSVAKKEEQYIYAQKGRMSCSCHYTNVRMENESFSALF